MTENGDADEVEDESEGKNEKKDNEKVRNLGTVQNLESL